MNGLFDVKDLLTVATANQAEINTKGYFGDNLSNLIEKVRQGKVEILADVIPDVTYCFKSNNDLHYVFFLPVDRVEKPYRALKNIDELFSFLMPDTENQNIDRHQKAQLLLGEQITLRRKEDNFIKVITIHEIDFYDNDDSEDSYLNIYLVNELFHYYEILIDGEWQPFGVKE